MMTDMVFVNVMARQGFTTTNANSQSSSKEMKYKIKQLDCYEENSLQYENDSISLGDIEIEDVYDVNAICIERED